ncbi:HutD/Ves family protein [Shewanella acanthi]|uniref:HutD/Ves family protein n=1 Tax=Shewanella acanthi TaxID=2864212 RepID=UPI001C6555E5|nr:HutD family protein [Shewanella acanthi]QYJ79942.1 HutD family protein [Shewanella acanthi]
MYTDFRLIHYRDCPDTPWKNGGGSTKQLFISPQSADLENFDYRISIAKVSSNGLFSRFKDVDRKLSILEGSGLRLIIKDEEGQVIDSQLLAPKGNVFAFDGENNITSELIGAFVLDFNVMTRRGKYHSEVDQLTNASQATIGEVLWTACRRTGYTLAHELLLTLEPITVFVNDIEIQLEAYDLLIFTKEARITLKNNQKFNGLIIKLSNNIN